MRGHQAGESKAGRKSWVRSRTFPRFWALLGVGEAWAWGWAGGLQSVALIGNTGGSPIFSSAAWMGQPVFLILFFCQRHVIEILKLSRKLFMSSIVSYRQLKCISAQSLSALLQTGQWVAVRGRLKPIQTGRRGDLIYDQSPLTNIARIALGDNGELQQYWVAQGRFNEAGTSVGAYFRRGDLPFYAAKAIWCLCIYVARISYFVHSGKTRRKV